MGSITNSPWYKRALIPLWIIHICLMLWNIITISLLLGIGYSNVQRIVALVICVIPFVLEVTEIVLFANRALSVVTYLIFQIIKVVLWIALLVFAIVTFVLMEEGRSRMALSPIAAAVILTCFIISLIYGAWTYHGVRHGRALRQPRVTEPEPVPYRFGPSSQYTSA